MLSGNRDDNRGMTKIVPPEGLFCSVLRDFQAHLEFREHGFTVRVISRTPARTLPDFHGGYPANPALAGPASLKSCLLDAKPGCAMPSCWLVAAGVDCKSRKRSSPG